MASQVGVPGALGRLHNTFALSGPKIVGHPPVLTRTAWPLYLFVFVGTLACFGVSVLFRVVAERLFEGNGHQLPLLVGLREGPYPGRLESAAVATHYVSGHCQSPLVGTSPPWLLTRYR